MAKFNHLCDFPVTVDFRPKPRRKRAKMRKEMPMIFTGPSIPALLDGSKTMTRRVIKIPPNRPNGIIVGLNPEGLPILAWGGGARHKASKMQVLKCPYAVGDLIWVRETHRLTRVKRGIKTWLRVEYKSEVVRDSCIREFREFLWIQIPKAQRERLAKISSWGKWRSPYFMYKFLARIWLKITEVKPPERVQDITPHDILAEAIESFGWTYTESSDGTGDKFLYWNDPTKDMPEWCPPNTTSCECVEDVFSWFWDSLNAKRGYGHKENPWVWPLGIKRIEHG